MSKENKKVEEEKPKKLAFYISFKQSEEQLYKDMKAVDDYSNVLKNLMREYLYGDKGTSENKTDDRSMVVTIDDICKILSSVNPVVPVAAAPGEGVQGAAAPGDNKNNDEGVGNVVTDPIPGDIVNQL